MASHIGSYRNPDNIFSNQVLTIVLLQFTIYYIYELCTFLFFLFFCRGYNCISQQSEENIGIFGGVFIRRLFSFCSSTERNWYPVFLFPQVVLGNGWKKGLLINRMKTMAKDSCGLAFLWILIFICSFCMWLLWYQHSEYIVYIYFNCLKTQVNLVCDDKPRRSWSSLKPLQ